MGFVVESTELGHIALKLEYLKIRSDGQMFKIRGEK